MSDNETAKLHMRFMVGGHAPASTDERLIRFEFPERPGALLNFLSSLGRRWNISLFHYRNHGAAYGRVLMGIQVPRAEHADFDQLLPTSATASGTRPTTPPTIRASGCAASLVAIGAVRATRSS
jgi:hypothetical protein